MCKIVVFVIIRMPQKERGRTRRVLEIGTSEHSEKLMTTPTPTTIRHMLKLAAAKPIYERISNP